MPSSDPATDSLPRSMGPLLAISVVLANVIGVGIFTTSGLLAKDLADPRLLLSMWLVGGVMSLAGALCYGELGANFPRAGGEYVYLREAYGPLPSFLSGWASLFAGFSAPIAAASVGFTEYLSAYYPELSLQNRSGYVLPGHLVATAVIVLLSAVHYRKVQLGGRVHVGLTFFKVGIIAVFVLAGFLIGRGDTSNFSPVIPLEEWPGLSAAMASGMIFVMFSYSGWNAAVYIGGEIRNPQRNLPMALFAGTAIVVILYILMNSLYLYAIPIGGMPDVIRIAEQASSNLFGLDVAPLLNIVFMGTILGSVSAMVIAGPRVYYAMARDGLFPRAIARVHPRFGTPNNAILLQAVWSIVLVFSGRFEQLLTFSGVVLIAFSCLTVSSVFVIRRRSASTLNYKGWGYPWTMLVFLSISLWILLVAFRDRPVESLLGLAVVTTGIPFYYYWSFKKRSG